MSQPHPDARRTTFLETSKTCSVVHRGTVVSRPGRLVLLGICNPRANVDRPARIFLTASILSVIGETKPLGEMAIHIFSLPGFHQGGAFQPALGGLRPSSIPPWTLAVVWMSSVFLCDLCGERLRINPNGTGGPLKPAVGLSGSLSELSCEHAVRTQALSANRAESLRGCPILPSFVRKGGHHRPQVHRNPSGISPVVPTLADNASVGHPSAVMTFRNRRPGHPSRADLVCVCVLIEPTFADTAFSAW
jgi:hypothetical protein